MKKKKKRAQSVKLGTTIVRRIGALAKSSSDPYVTAELRSIQSQIRELETFLDRAYKFWDKALIRAEESERVTLALFSVVKNSLPLMKSKETRRQGQGLLKGTLALHKDYMRAMRAEKPRENGN